ncbi:MAG TPA: SMP-30/gluconolactonase/LRE family protein [Usitatibacter sp.]|jgi:gluconolactonase|nr:SMP-30/gluconolactonase/LRE family protein [Usitatibacter sp.]
MWNLSNKPPQVIEARVLTRLPDAFRRKRRTEWSDANKPGYEVDSFLEGPTFDREGNLYVVDIPFGRIFRISPALEWTLVAEYDGWPNGLALHRDGSLWIADYRRGLLRLSSSTLAASSSSPTRASATIGDPEVLLAHRNSESFKGLNDLTFDRDGNCYFTDQGQTGLHDPSGRVYRLRTTGQLDLVIGGIPSPNGVALDRDGKFLYVAVTRANQVWRGPLLADGNVSKVGAFRTFFGTSGPDGMAVDVDNRIVVAHASLGGAFVINAQGEVTHFVKSPAGSTVTNVAYRPGTARLVVTESESGSILEAELSAPGAPLFSHA